MNFSETVLSRYKLKATSHQALSLNQKLLRANSRTGDRRVGEHHPVCNKIKVSVIVSRIIQTNLRKV